MGRGGGGTLLVPLLPPPARRMVALTLLLAAKLARPPLPSLADANPKDDTFGGSARRPLLLLPLPSCDSADGSPHQRQREYEGEGQGGQARE